ncbi:MAG: zinc-binding dehydrogenase [Ancrocorticia sp.]|uniref:zinc-binding dehydrogenase n=1 Tax=Ancrocorticia sp. TaxID=2593684 RepID=UPI003F8FA618
MRALLLSAPGSIGNLAIGHPDKPEPGAGQVRIRVEAASLNPVDVSTIRSEGNPAWDWPHIPAQDAAGTVDALGPGVEGFEVGDRVANHGSMADQGSLAEYRLAHVETLARIPDDVKVFSAAALPCAGLTAYQAIVRRLHVQPGQTVLVTSAAGGGFAVQLATLAGARVIGTASKANHEHVRQLGATDVIDYHSEDVVQRTLELTNGRGVDAVLDLVSPESATANLQALVHNGGLAFAAGRPDLNSVEPFTIAPSIHELALGAAYGSKDPAARERLATDLEELLKLVDEGRLDPMIERVVPLDEAPEALAEVGERHVRGKLVVEIGPEI